MWLSLILFSEYERWEADLFLQLWNIVLFLLNIKLKCLIDFLLKKGSSHSWLRIPFKALRHLSAILPTATYAQAFNNSCMRCFELT